MEELVQKPTQDNQADNTADEVGIVQYPPGFPGAEWLIAKAKHLKNAHKTWFSPTLLSIQENHKLYEVKHAMGTLPGGTIIPIVTSVIDTMAGRLVSGLVPRDRFVDAIADDPELKAAGPMTGPDADVNRQEVVTDFINETIGTTKDFADKVDETIKMLLLEDVTFVECKWSIEPKVELRVQERQPDPMAPPTALPPITETVPYEYEVGRPDFEPLSVRLCGWDPRCKTKVSESPWFFKTTMASINDLFTMQEAGIIESVDEVVKKTSKSLTPDAPNDPDAKQSQAVEGQQLPAVGWDDGVWEVDTWWATLAWKDEQGVFHSGKFEFWIVGGDTVVKFRPNILIPQRTPIVTIKASRKTGQLLAQGPVDVIKGMQRALDNNMANVEQLIKNASYSPTFYEPSSGLDGRKVSLQSNSLIPVLSVKGIQRMEPAVQAISNIEKFINFIIGQMDRATAATEQAQGVDSNVDTLGQAEILAQGSNSKFGYLTEMINASMFGGSGIAEEFHLLWKQFGEPGQMIVKDGSNEGKGYEVQPEDLQGCYVFKPVPTQSQQAKLRHFGMLQGMLEKLLELQAKAPGMLVNNEGQPMQVKTYDFLVNQMLPLVNVQARGLFGLAPPPPMPGMPMPGMPPMAAGGPPMPEPMPEMPPEMAAV